MRKVSLTGNSLAYLLCQEQKCATADVRVVSNRRPDIRKISLVVAALILAGVGAWAASTTQARVATPASDSIDPTQLTMSVKGHLPVAKFVDYSVLFPEHEN
jgi:hypothetical protein